jgi:SAM-dependent methyltransferase
MERPELWGHLKDAPDILEKIRVFREMIPADVRTIADVGCGDGAITNALGEHWKVTGVDSSRTALQHVTTESVLADASRLPFDDWSFDVVMSSQMLEHLDDMTYTAAVAELQRAARRYVLISVPHEEDLEMRFIKCPVCGSREHVWGHVRRFSAESLAADFSDFEVVEVRIFGDLQDPPWPKPLLWAMHNVVGGWYEPEGQNPQCSHCGNADYTATRGFSPYLSLVKKTVDHVRLRPRKPYWLAMLSRRRATP